MTLKEFQMLKVGQTVLWIEESRAPKCAGRIQDKKEQAVYIEWLDGQQGWLSVFAAECIQAVNKIKTRKGVKN